jgi:hypothetical protein
VPGFLPGFASVPASLDDLQLVHGSCRKIGGGGIDALGQMFAVGR